VFIVHNSAQVKEFSVCSRWLFAPYSLLCGVAVIYVFTWRVWAEERCCVPACVLLWAMQCVFERAAIGCREVYRV
jgi:hypothetical protein